MADLSQPTGPQQRAQRVEHEVEHGNGAPQREEGFVLPRLEELKGQSAVAEELGAAELQEAYELAKSVDLRDAVKAMKFGFEDQETASKVTRAFINDIRKADLEGLSEIAREQNRHMEDLNIGELEPSYVQKLIRRFIPGAQASAVQAYLDKHSTLSDLVDAGEQALAEERLKLDKLQEQMTEKIDENQEVYNQMTKNCAAAELIYAAEKKRVAEYKEQHKDSKSPARLREISLMDQALAMQARRINSLKASRMETLNALNTMDLQVQRIHSQMEMIDQQRTFNRLVWDNTVMMAATDRQMSKSVEAVRYNRNSIEKMMKDRTGSIGETLKKILEEEKAGVVNAAVLEYAAREVIKLNRTIIEGNKAIRDSMAEADQVIERIDGEVKNVLANAAAMSEEDVRALDEFLEMAKIDTDEKEAVKAANERRR